MLSIIRLFHLNAVLINVFSLPVCVVEVIDRIQCGNIYEDAEGIQEGFSICRIHRILNLLFKGSIDFFVPLVDLEGF